MYMLLYSTFLRISWCVEGGGILQQDHPELHALVSLAEVLPSRQSSAGRPCL